MPFLVDLFDQQLSWSIFVFILGVVMLGTFIYTLVTDGSPFRTAIDSVQFPVDKMMTM
ncbi:transmembrane protein, putative [Medicago truncatula]|uniref:Transmembrane protein, putative n=1 Tax=Medicago truncatula TaxID=3880 RepID=G7IP80_MEDTR|nr:transmembrane protein, putative [Medicago truncatula]